MFIAPAYAQGAGATGFGSSFSAFIPIILIFVVFYFLLIRPQQKKMKDHQAMLNSIRRGDKVVTNGGIIGTVTKVIEEERELQVEIAQDVRIRVKQDMLSSVLTKTEPANANDPKSDDKK
ncbi:MAG: preprotein translocase subunit YajC [Rhodospirillaceae bacterium]|jgi:preprotein translocase subunit YajC|nr:preprotein translocase subunit YajC [Rhodospirillaceae bacterium]